MDSNHLLECVRINLFLACFIFASTMLYGVSYGSLIEQNLYQTITILEWFEHPWNSLSVCCATWALCLILTMTWRVLRAMSRITDGLKVCVQNVHVYTYVRMHDCEHKFVCTLSCIYSLCVFPSLTSHAWFQQMELVSYSWHVPRPKQLWIINKLCRKPHTHFLFIHSFFSIFLSFDHTHADDV